MRTNFDRSTEALALRGFFFCMSRQGSQSCEGVLRWQKPNPSLELESIIHRKRECPSWWPPSLRRALPPFHVSRRMKLGFSRLLDGGFKVLDSNGQSLTYVYGHADSRDAQIAKGLTLDEARR